MLNYIRKVINKDAGASAVEYGLLVAGIAVVIIVAVFALGGTLSDTFDKTENCIATAPTTC